MGERINEYFAIFDNVLHTDLFYPGIGGRPDTIEVGLCAVRASDGIRIKYDFDRDGWVILQERLKNDGGGIEETGEWVEVAFVQSWALEED